MKRFTIAMIVIGIAYPLVSQILSPRADIREAIYWSVGCLAIWLIVIFVNWILSRKA